MPYPHANENVEDAGVIFLLNNDQLIIRALAADLNLKFWFINSVFDEEVLYLDASKQPGLVDLEPRMRAGENQLFVRAFNPQGGPRGDVAACAYDIMISRDAGVQVPLISIADITESISDRIVGGGERAKQGIFHHIRYVFSRQ